MQNTIRLVLLLIVAAVVTVGSPAMAFHDDGVAHCNGCHTMHNSQNGVAMNFNAAGTGPGTLPGFGWNDLLLFPNKTDVCLRCHAGSGSYHVWSPDPLAPTTWNRGGGDFVFLEEDNINDAHAGGSNPVLGNQAGHSVVSGIKSTAADPDLATSPGGAYPAVDMACTSCHDPHGTDSYRLTYRDGQTTTSDTGVVINWTSTISGIATSVFAAAESPGNHNVYQAGYSAWCGECHGDFHAASANLIHPSGELLDTAQVQVYNAYRGTADCIANPPGGGAPCGSGLFAGAYLYLVPLQDATIVSNAYLDGATDGSSGVACMSCHRAHASSAMDAGRWDFNVTGMAEDGVESSSFDMSVSIPAAYDPTTQRSLCNKCHSRDEFDALVTYP